MTIRKTLIGNTYKSEKLNSRGMIKNKDRLKVLVSDKKKPSKVMAVGVPLRAGTEGNEGRFP
jgi:hypothetical protein